eukprot:scaffold222944_cov40-Prasinocladus_malaysianus.AAC.1
MAHRCLRCLPPPGSIGAGRLDRAVRGPRRSALQVQAQKAANDDAVLWRLFVPVLVEQTRKQESACKPV